MSFTISVMPLCQLPDTVPGMSLFYPQMTVAVLSLVMHKLENKQQNLSLQKQYLEYV
jgi:hypothetical protein